MEARGYPETSIFYHNTALRVNTEDYGLWSRILREKLIVIQLIKKCPTFWGTRGFNTAFTKASHWSLPWVRCNQSTPSHSISLRSILMLYSYLHLGLPTGLFPSEFSMHFHFCGSPFYSSKWICKKAAPVCAWKTLTSILQPNSVLRISSDPCMRVLTAV